MDLRYRPIGVFDSGVGGLTVVKGLLEKLPGERIIYFGDTARVPYGTKSKKTITKFSIGNVKFLLQFRVKLVVAACNTSSSLALPTLKRRFDLPILGVVGPGARKAVRISKSGRIGVIGTKATIASRVYSTYIKRLRPTAKVYSQDCPLFVPLAEEGWLSRNITKDIARAYLGMLKRKNIDTLILGCTHYPLLKQAISKVMRRGVRLVDSASETVEEVKALLYKEDLLSVRKRVYDHRYFLSDEPADFVKIGERFLGRRIRLVERRDSL